VPQPRVVRQTSIYLVLHMASSR